MESTPPQHTIALVSIVIAIAVAIGSRDHDARRLVEKEFARALFIPIVEVEHVVERSGDGIERAARLDALTRQPVVLDEPQHRGLVGQGVIDMVPLRERRNHQQRHAGSVTATTPFRLAEIAVERPSRDWFSPLPAIALLAPPSPVQ